MNTFQETSVNKMRVKKTVTGKTGMSLAQLVHAGVGYWPETGVMPQAGLR